MSGNAKATAQCECGKCSLEITTPPVVQLVCHCADCRALTGMPYTEGVFFTASGCTVQGPTKSQTMKGGSGYDKTYYSCSKCGTSLYATVNALNGAWAVLANRLTTFEFKAQAHVWTSEKAEGVTIPASMAQSPNAPPKEIRDIMLRAFWGRG